MRAVCLLALLVPAACLHLEKSKTQSEEFKNDRPRYANITVGNERNIEVVWQRPSQEIPTGAFMYLHGCGNRALDTWSTKQDDGSEFAACKNTKKGYCAGLPQEGMMKEIARKRGYIFIAVQGGITSNRGCFHPEDVPRIKLAIKHVYTVEKLGDMPLIMSGMSAGGRILGELATSNGGPGVPMKCAAVQVAELNSKAAWAWPTNVPIMMIHMPKDGLTEKLIGKTFQILKNHKTIYVNKEINAAPIDKEFLMAGGHGLNETTATKALTAFTKAGLLNEKGNLKSDPYNPKPKTRWMKAIEDEAPDGSLRGEVGGFGQQATVTKLMERSWATHSLSGDKTTDIIDFCENPPADAKEAKKRDMKQKTEKSKKGTTTV